MINPEINEASPLLMEKSENMSKEKHKRVFTADICSLFFGIGTWVLINGMFTQLPLLVQTQPEEWKLPSYLVILIQLANIGPIAYSIVRIGYPQYLRDKFLIYAVMILGCFAMLYMSLYYQQTTYLFSKLRSTHLFVAVFLIALMCCTSSVLFTPFMGSFPEVYLISYLLGEGLSGFLPSIIALIQGIGSSNACVNTTLANGSTILVPEKPQPPLFSTQVFFNILLVLMVLSLLSFFCLNHLPSLKKLKLIKQKERNSSRSSLSKGRPKDNTEKLSPMKYAGLLFLQGLVAFFSHGVLPSLQSYSCLPYGAKAYHYTANLTNMASTAACFLAYVWLVKSVKVISSFSIVAGIVVFYSVLTAVMSPNPPLQSSTLGAVIIIINWVLSAGLISYIKLSLAAIFRSQEGKGLFWYGAVNQLGSASGALVIFVLINYTYVFKEYSCANESS